MTTASYGGARAPITDDVPDLINVVLTFESPDGKRWLAGALLGPLEPLLGDGGQPIRVSEIIDLPLVVTRFTVVRDDRQ